MNFLYIILIIFLLVVVFNLIESRYTRNKQLSDINLLLNKIGKILDSEDEQQIRLDILKLRPWINKHVRLSSISLTYDEDSVYFFIQLEPILSSLKMRRDELAFISKEPLSLKDAILNSFLLPATILGWFGLNLSTVKAKVFSALFLLFTILSNNYGKEFFDWLFSLFR